MSGNPTQPTNVVPMPTNWPGPSFMPKTWPSSGPSCFSELASLNACYDSIQMMNQILAKVMTDLVTNDPAVQKAIVDAIAASGSNVPLIGVTNGSNAQPGQVGEFIELTANVTFPATTINTQTVNLGNLQPGDWDLTAFFAEPPGNSGGSYFYLTPQPAGFTTPLLGISYTISSGGASLTAGQVLASPARASITTVTPLVFSLSTNITVNGSATVSSGVIIVQGRRAR